MIFTALPWLRGLPREMRLGMESMMYWKKHVKIYFKSANFNVLQGDVIDE